MFSSLFRPKNPRRPIARRRQNPRQDDSLSPTAQDRFMNDNGSDRGDDVDEEAEQAEDEEEEEHSGDEEDYRDTTPLLPIFSAAHLGIVSLLNA